MNHKGALLGHLGGLALLAKRPHGVLIAYNCHHSGQSGFNPVAGKVLYEVAGRPLILFMIERVRRVSELDDVVIATSENEENDALAAAASDAGVSVFRGSEDDVLERFDGAAADQEAEPNRAFDRRLSDHRSGGDKAPSYSNERPMISIIVVTLNRKRGRTVLMSPFSPEKLWPVQIVRRRCLLKGSMWCRGCGGCRR